MNQDEITPEYILEQSKVLPDDELLCLIENYGNQQYDKGSEASAWDYH